MTEAENNEVIYEKLRKKDTPRQSISSLVDSFVHGTSGRVLKSVNKVVDGEKLQYFPS
jgi:hypothetical protein